MEFVLKDIVNKLSEDDIRNFAFKEGICLTNDELKTIYVYIKNYWHIFFKGDATFLFEELKDKLEPKTYTKVVELYNKYKKK